MQFFGIHTEIASIIEVIMSPLIRPAVVRWWCGFGLVENTCANIALLEFMFHGIKTCRLQTLQMFMTSQCALNHHHSLINSELGNIYMLKKNCFANILTMDPQRWKWWLLVSLAAWVGGFQSWPMSTLRGWTSDVFHKNLWTVAN